jgi:hypothetical protein
MREAKLEAITSDAVAAARDMAEVARGVMGRAAVYARTHRGVVSEHARGLASDAGEALQAWRSQTRGVMRARPLQVLAVALGIGYVIGRMLRRA